MKSFLGDFYRHLATFYWSHWATQNFSSLILTDRFAEVDRVFELLPEDPLARVPRHLEQEEAGVTFRQEVVGRVVLVHDLERVQL